MWKYSEQGIELSLRHSPQSLILVEGHNVARVIVKKSQGHRVGSFHSRNQDRQFSGRTGRLALPVLAFKPLWLRGGISHDSLIFFFCTCSLYYKDTSGTGRALTWDSFPSPPCTCVCTCTHADTLTSPVAGLGPIL